MIQLDTKPWFTFNWVPVSPLSYALQRGQLQLQQVSSFRQNKGTAFGGGGGGGGWTYSEMTASHNNLARLFLEIMTTQWNYVNKETSTSPEDESGIDQSNHLKSLMSGNRIHETLQERVT
jgi:hypothetical protein